MTLLPLRLMVVSLCAVLLTCCASKPEPSPQQKKPVDKNQPRLVGRIASIYADRSFVLIQSYGTWEIQSQTILATFGPNGRAANLKVTGEKLGQFAAADIQSGTLEIGDGVYTTLTTPEEPSEP